MLCMKSCALVVHYSTCAITGYTEQENYMKLATLIYQWPSCTMYNVHANTRWAKTLGKSIDANGKGNNSFLISVPDTHMTLYHQHISMLVYCLHIFILVGVLQSLAQVVWVKLEETILLWRIWMVLQCHLGEQVSKYRVGMLTKKYLCWSRWL